jgi:hypothetical protein
MKKIISENNLYDMIPNQVRRRLEDGDIDIIYGIVNKLYKSRGYWMNYRSFEDYFNAVILHSISSFIYHYKDLSNLSFKERDIMEEALKDLAPFLRKKYHNKLRKFYKDMNN